MPLFTHNDPVGDTILGLVVVCVLVWACAIMLAAHLRIKHPVDENVIVSISQVQRWVRKHSPGGGYYKDPVDADLSKAQTILLTAVVDKHWDRFQEPWRHSEHPVDAPALGRHHAENPARTLVAAGWVPPIGDRRIRLLEENTVQIEGWLQNIPQWS